MLVIIWTWHCLAIFTSKWYNMTHRLWVIVQLECISSKRGINYLINSKKSSLNRPVKNQKMVSHKWRIYFHWKQARGSNQVQWHVKLNRWTKIKGVDSNLESTFHTDSVFHSQIRFVFAEHASAYAFCHLKIHSFVPFYWFIFPYNLNMYPALPYQYYSW